MAQALCESGIKALAIFDIQPGLGQSAAQALHNATDISVKYYNVDVTNEKNVESQLAKFSNSLRARGSTSSSILQV